MKESELNIWAFVTTAQAAKAEEFVAEYLFVKLTPWEAGTNDMQLFTNKHQRGRTQLTA